MLFWRRTTIITLVTSFLIIITALNVYFVYSILKEKYETQEQVKVKPPHKVRKDVFPHRAHKRRETFHLKDTQRTASINAANKIRSMAKELAQKNRNPSKDLNFIVEKVINDLVEKNNVQFNMWQIAQQWTTGTQVLPEKAPLLGNVLNTLCSSQITKADNSKKGTQLKLFLTLKGGQRALLKPQRYPREEVIEGAVYAGMDRHNAEVAAFHLSLLLNLRRVPLTVGRKVNLRREVVPVATQGLLKTFFQDGNNTCFYGKCLFCKRDSPACANGDIIEGALIMWLSKMEFQTHPHPWRRTYNDTLIARWEVDEGYCRKIKSAKEYDPSLLLDLIDAVVFDFLTGNGDRHHYEVPSNVKPTGVFLLDNGKGFGNPHVDHLDILAPLYQCCMIRKSTLDRLKIFAGGGLGYSLGQTLKYSHIHPVLTESHLSALDRRLIFILAAVEICLRENEPSKASVERKRSGLRDDSMQSGEQPTGKKEIIVKRISAAEFEVYEGEQEQEQEEEREQEHERGQEQEQKKGDEEQKTPVRESVIQRAPPAGRRTVQNGSEEPLEKRRKVDVGVVGDVGATGVILIREAIMYRIVEILMWKVLGEGQLKALGYPRAGTQEVLWKVVYQNCLGTEGKKSSGAELTQDHHCKGNLHCFSSHVFRFLDTYAPDLFRRTGWGRLSCEELLRRIYHEDLVPYLRAVDLRNSLGVLQCHSDIVLLEKWEKQKFTAVTWSGQKYISQMWVNCPRCPQCSNRHF